MTSDLFTSVAKRFEPIALAQMDKVSFLSRKDTKYVMCSDQLLLLLEEMMSNYRILEIDEIREFTYNSRYLDTNSFGMYMAHHNKRKNRFKCRMRVYENTGLTFWEIKHKTNRNLTTKKRIKINPEGVSEEQIEAFIHSHSPYQYTALEPKLESRFKRMTFVNNKMTERVTIDRELSWSNNKNEIHLDGLTIVEVKNDCKATLAELYPILHKLRIRQGSFSKYTFGCALLYSHLKHNMLKTKLTYINQFCHASSSQHSIHA